MNDKVTMISTRSAGGVIVNSEGEVVVGLLKFKSPK